MIFSGEALPRVMEVSAENHSNSGNALAKSCHYRWTMCNEFVGWQGTLSTSTSILMPMLAPLLLHRLIVVFNFFTTQMIFPSYVATTFWGPQAKSF